MGVITKWELLKKMGLKQSDALLFIELCKEAGLSHDSTYYNDSQILILENLYESYKESIGTVVVDTTATEVQTYDRPKFEDTVINKLMLQEKQGRVILIVDSKDSFGTGMILSSKSDPNKVGYTSKYWPLGSLVQYEGLTTELMKKLIDLFNEKYKGNYTNLTEGINIVVDYNEKDESDYIDINGIVNTFGITKTTFTGSIAPRCIKIKRGIYSKRSVLEALKSAPRIYPTVVRHLEKLKKIELPETIPEEKEPVVMGNLLEETELYIEDSKPCIEEDNSTDIDLAYCDHGFNPDEILEPIDENLFVNTELKKLKRVNVEITPEGNTILTIEVLGSSIEDILQTILKSL